MIKELMFEGSNRYFDKMICPELEISENSIQNLCDTLYHKALENSKSQFEKDAVTPLRNKIYYHGEYLHNQTIILYLLMPMPY